MNRIIRIREKIERIENLLTEIKNELETLSKERVVQPKKLHKEEPLPPEEELRAEYERLYDAYIKKNFKPIEEFFKGKNKNYLKAFCKANTLPIDTTKLSKDGIMKEVMNWFGQRQAITKKST